MIKVNMEFRKGILFVRLEGVLNKRTVNDFNNEVIPVVLKHGLKYIVINFDKISSIDLKGIEALMEINEIVSRWNGKTSLCSLTSESVRSTLNESSISDKYFETSNELTALEVLKI